MAPVFILCWTFFDDADLIDRFLCSIGTSAPNFHPPMCDARRRIERCVFLTQTLTNRAVPLVFTLVFSLSSNARMSLPIVVRSMSRSGRPSELAQGPVHYGITMVLATLFWFKRMEGMILMLVVAFGDGFASLVADGGRVSTPGGDAGAGSTSVGAKRAPLPWNRNKTWVGLISFVAAALVAIMLYTILFYA